MQHVPEYVTGKGDFTLNQLEPKRDEPKTTWRAVYNR